MLKKIKKRVYEILEVATENDLASKIYDIFSIIVITLNVIAVIIETVNSVYQKYTDIFRTFEIISVMIFTVDYFLRLWSCTIQSKYRNAFIGRIKFAFTPLALVDLFSILPFYLPMIFSVDLRFIRILRLFRFLRLLKLWRYSVALNTFGHVLREKKEELLISIFSVLILLIIASCLMYFIENEAQPEAFSNIPSSMWWGIATLTTVGYGDIYPVTTLGKILGAIIALLGIGMFALPAGILASGFAEVIQNRKENNRRCPHCRKEI